MQVKSLGRLDEAERTRIVQRARTIRDGGVDG
jgi:hypothetical protein